MPVMLTMESFVNELHYLRKFRPAKKYPLYNMGEVSCKV